MNKAEILKTKEKFLQYVDDPKKFKTLIENKDGFLTAKDIQFLIIYFSYMDINIGSQNL